MSKKVKVTVYTDDDQETTVEVTDNEAREYEEMAFTSKNITNVKVESR